MAEMRYVAALAVQGASKYCGQLSRMEDWRDWIRAGSAPNASHREVAREHDVHLLGRMVAGRRQLPTKILRASRPRTQPVSHYEHMPSVKISRVGYLLGVPTSLLFRLERCIEPCLVGLRSVFGGATALGPGGGQRAQEDADG